MSIADGASSQFARCLRGRDPAVRAESARRGRGSRSSRLKHAVAKSPDDPDISIRTFDLLHEGYGTIGVGRLRAKTQRRTGWTMIHSDKAKISSVQATTRMTARPPHRPASAPANSATKSPLAQRRRQTAQTLKLESDAKARELPANRATWIVEQESASRQNASISFHDDLAIPPSEPRDDRYNHNTPLRADDGVQAQENSTDQKLAKPHDQKSISNIKRYERMSALQAEARRLYKERLDQSLDGKRRAELEQAIVQIHSRYQKDFDELVRTLEDASLVDANEDGIIDTFEMHAMMLGKATPTRPVGGRIAELATPRHPRQYQRQVNEIYHVGEGERMQQHEAIGCGWVRVLELSGEVYFWHPRLRKSQWDPPPHAGAEVQAWQDGRAAMSPATLASLTRRRQLIQSGKPVEDLRKCERARRRRDAKRLKQAQLKEAKAQRQKETRMRVLDKEVRMLGWIAKLGHEAHARFVEYVTLVQAKWRGIIFKRTYRTMRENIKKRQVERLQRELLYAIRIQKCARGFLDRKRLRYLLETPFAVYIILGPPGSGKTALGARLAETYGMIRLSPPEILRSELRKTRQARASSPIPEDDIELMKQSITGGHIFPLHRMMPILKLHVTRARLQRPHAACLLDGFPISVSQTETLECCDPPFEFCKYVYTFVCMAPQTVAMDRALKQARMIGVAEDAVYTFTRKCANSLQDVQAALAEPEHFQPSQIAIQSLKLKLESKSFQYCRQRAVRKFSTIDPAKVNQLEKRIRGEWKGVGGNNFQVNQAVKTAFVDLIIKTESKNLAHWMMPSDQRIIKIDTGPEYTPDDSYAMLLQRFTETQYIVQEYICKQALRIDTKNVALQSLLAHARLEEKARLMSIEVAAYLTRGGDAYSVHSFAEAVSHHEKAYTLVLEAQNDESERARWETQVRELTTQYHEEEALTNAVRWRPEFPSELMLDKPEQSFACDDWSVPINPDEIKRALDYSARAKKDFDFLVNARLEADDFLITGNAAVQNKDLELAEQLFEKALAFRLTELRFTHALVDVPLVEKLEAASMSVKDAIKVRNLAREKCCQLEREGSHHLDLFHGSLRDAFQLAEESVDPAVELFTRALELAESEANDATLVQRMRDGLAKANHDVEIVRQNEEGQQLCEQAQQAMEAHSFVKAAMLAAKAQSLAHSNALKDLQAQCLVQAEAAVAERDLAVKRAAEVLEAARSALATHHNDDDVGVAKLSAAAEQLGSATEQAAQAFDSDTDASLHADLTRVRLTTTEALHVATLVRDVQSVLESADDQELRRATIKSREALDRAAALEHGSSAHMQALAKQVAEQLDGAVAASSDPEANAVAGANEAL